MIENSNIKIGVIAIALVAGIAIKLYLGTTNPTEIQAESFIETVVKDSTGVDLTPILS
jgi:hypothetical protein